MHLLALGAFWRRNRRAPSPPQGRTGLNAPFGARCFQAGQPVVRQDRRMGPVLMHLLALGAFWHELEDIAIKPTLIVLMHLLALGAFWPINQGHTSRQRRRVLMHLLALGAFWRL